MSARVRGPLHQLGEGLWSWTARHPEWHPRTEFGAEVVSFALRVGPDTVLIDPLLADGEDAVATSLDEIVAGRVTVLITIPYHVRSAADIWRRYGDAVEILGHQAVAKRLPSGAPFRGVAAGEPLPHGVSAHAIGSPRRQELPMYVPGQRALAFGDALVGIDGGLRVWLQAPVTDQRLDWYRRRLVPTLEPLLDLDVERVLVTHGSSVLRAGRRALREALDAPPWYHRPT